MYIKCELRLNAVSYDVTNDLRNWEDIETAYKRSGMDGIVRSFISEFVFVGATRNLIASSVMASGLSNDISVSLYVQNNSWTWNKVFDCQLDMSTVSITNKEASFSCVDGTIASRLKAKKSTKFEYEVSSFQTESMTFDRIHMNNWEKYVLTFDSKVDAAGDVSNTFSINQGNYTIPLYYTDNSIVVPGAIECKDQEQSEWGRGSGGYDVCVCVAMKSTRARVRFYLELDSDHTFNRSPELYIHQYKSKTGRQVSLANSETVPLDSSGRITKNIKLDVDMYVDMEPADKIIVYIYTPYTGNQSDEVKYNVVKYYRDDTNCTLRIDWEDKGKPVDFDCLKPEALMNGLLGSICGSGITGEIDDDGNERLSKCRLAAAESVRGFDVSKIYSSWGDLCNFMESVFGYVCTIDQANKKVRFVHRDSLFKETVSKTIENYKDLKLSVNSSLLYSSVDVGMKAVEYDEENGIYEYNFRQSFTTGRNLNEKTLTLDPVYRVDSLGIEYLVEKRVEDSKDTSSDKDIFAIYTNGEESLKPDTSYVSSISGRPSGEMFNQVYHPRFCIEANKMYIGAIADVLSYASSEGNTGWVFDGIHITGDVEIGDKKYSAFNVEFDTDDLLIPEDVNGKVSVGMYSGWITQLKEKYTRQEKANYILLLDSSTFGN